MDLTAMLGEWRPRWSSQGNIVMDCPYVEKHTHRAGSGKHSLTIWPGIQVFKCYSCATSGAILPLLTEKLKLDYFEAINALATLPEQNERERLGFELNEVLELVPPKVYLKRGFSAELLKKFRVGRSDGKTVISLFFLDELKGLQYRVETPSGKMVWNTDGFDSDSYLYNYRPKRKSVIVVEGYADVWRLFMYGYHAEALLGTSVTPGKLALLRERDRVYLAMDNDDAGVRATEKLYLRLKDYVDVRFVAYPSGDPDECTKRAFARGYTAWLDYAGYQYQRIMEYLPADETEPNWYLTMQKEELKKYQREGT